MAATAFDEAYWASAGGAAWIDLQPLTDRLYAPIGEAILAAAGLQAGQTVLDIGCGAGATTLETARRLGPDGACVGVDVSDSLLEAGRRAAKAEGVANASFVTGDAQTQVFDRTFDAAISRFGVMFFADPVAAFANIRGALKPDGRLTFASWRSADENPLAALPIEAAQPFLPDLTVPSADKPGRFFLSDPARIEDILSRSGWQTVRIEPLDIDTPLSVAEMTDVTLRIGVLGTAAAGLSLDDRTRLGQSVEDHVARVATDGVAPMQAACWLVTAEA